MVYVVDLVIFSNNIDDELKQIEQILTLLGEAEMTLRLSN